MQPTFSKDKSRVENDSFFTCANEVKVTLIHISQNDPGSDLETSSKYG